MADFETDRTDNVAFRHPCNGAAQCEPSDLDRILLSRPARPVVVTLEIDEPIRLLGATVSLVLEIRRASRVRQSDFAPRPAISGPVRCNLFPAT